MKVRNRATIRKLDISKRIQMMSSIKDALPIYSNSPDPPQKTIEPVAVNTLRRSISNIGMSLRAHKEETFSTDSPQHRKLIIIEETDLISTAKYRRSSTISLNPPDKQAVIETNISPLTSVPDKATNNFKEKRPPLISASLTWKSKGNLSQNTSRSINSRMATECQSGHLTNSILSQASPNTCSLLSHRSRSNNQDLSGIHLHSSSNEILSTKASDSHLKHWFVKRSLGLFRNNSCTNHPTFLNSLKTHRPSKIHEKEGVAIYPMNSFPVYQALWC